MLKYALSQMSYHDHAKVGTDVASRPVRHLNFDVCLSLCSQCITVIHDMNSNR